MDIYKMKLHDEIELDKNNTVKRVPGGWMYSTFTQVDGDGWSSSSVFVPYNPEFRN